MVSVVHRNSRQWPIMEYRKTSGQKLGFTYIDAESQIIIGRGRVKVTCADRSRVQCKKTVRKHLFISSANSPYIF